MNGESIRGGAFGFNLTSLSEFYCIRSNDNKITLFQFIINTIMDEDKEILNFIQDLECFEKIKMKIASIQK